MASPRPRVLGERRFFVSYVFSLPKSLGSMINLFSKMDNLIQSHRKVNLKRKIHVPRETILTISPYCLDPHNSEWIKLNLYFNMKTFVFVDYFDS